VASKALFIEEKIGMSMRALDATGIPSLLDVLFPAGPQFSAERRETFKSSLEKWSRGQPTDNEVFWRRLKSELEVSAEIGILQLMTCSPKEFVQLLPAEMQSRVLAAPPTDVAKWKLGSTAPALNGVHAQVEGIAAVAENQEPSSTRLYELTSGLHTAHIDIDHHHYDISNAIRNRRLDQTYLYFDRQSAKNWKALTKANRYPTFRYCLDTLSAFTTSEWCSESVDAGQIASVVMLGAGSPQKDMVILDRFAQSNSYDHQHPLNYLIVDTSAHMILETIKDLRDFGAERYKKFVNMVTVIADFMKLQHIQDCLADQGVSIRGKEGKAVYFIPGGTISNVDEEQFMKSVRAVSLRGDFLVIGVEFIDESDKERYKAKLKSKYDHEDLRRLVIPPIFWALSDTEKKEAITAITDPGQTFIGVNVLEIEGPSSLKNLITVSVTAKIDGRPVVLAKASRYRKDEFISFVNQYGYELLGFVPHKDEPQYNQAIFVRV